MPSLVPIPWQPDLYLTPDTLAYLQAASTRLNTHLAVAAGDGAWRSYASQKALRDYYLADPENRPFAADPDTGQRNHMRGAAFDLVRTDAAAQAACRAVGLIRDEAEPWHWNNPRWTSMPIVPDLTAAASTGDATLINQITATLEANDMLPLLIAPGRLPLLGGPFGSINLADPGSSPQAKERVEVASGILGTKTINARQYDVIHQIINEYAANAKKFFRQ